MDDPRQQLPGKPSDDATPAQLSMAREQGDAYIKALDAMREQNGRGAMQPMRDYHITCTAEYAQGYYEWQEGELVWTDPVDENAHIEVAVTDAWDGRFVPYLQVTVRVFASGQDVPLTTAELPFIWHPWLHHYGVNTVLPDSDVYDIEVMVSGLPTRRHDQQNGRRFTQPATVRFSNMPIEVGQK